MRLSAWCNKFNWLTMSCTKSDIIICFMVRWCWMRIFRVSMAFERDALGISCARICWRTVRWSCVRVCVCFSLLDLSSGRLCDEYFVLINRNCVRDVPDCSMVSGWQRKRLSIQMDSNCTRRALNARIGFGRSFVNLFSFNFALRADIINSQKQKLLFFRNHLHKCFIHR